EEDLEALREISGKLGLEDAKAERFKPPVDESGGGVDLVKLSGGLAGAGEGGAVPTWLTVMTGGVVVGASFLFASLLTDHGTIRAVADWEVRLPAPDAALSAAAGVARAASVAALGLVAVVGVVGPPDPTRNLAILVVWVGWWAGYTMSVYAVGTTWGALNPWRALADRLPRLADRTYPDRLGAWPAVVGLLGLVWIEVVSPVAADARLLVAVVAAYTAVTLAGAAAYGADTWFDRVDPISRVFAAYGRIAPVQRTDDGLALRLPTTTLIDARVRGEPGRAAFVVALLWVTTYDGLVTTPAWAAAIRPLVGAGVPPRALYLAAIVGGFAAFYAVYGRASDRVRRSADSYVAADYVGRYFAPALLPIAAGYHVAHFLGYFLALTPAFATVVLDPLSPPAVELLAMPAWFGSLQLGFVLVGHLLAVWVGHALAFDLFPGVLRPIRSQYPYVVVMILYTMTSAWVVIQPFRQPPFV
ncbi:MAG: hypothetical protein ABEH40_04115, partial [Haloferacaceae archaeon]